MVEVPHLKDIPVVILCGGQGMRIREISELLPKPMLPIGGRPVLWHIMMIYAAHGFRRFILCLGYKGEEIKDYFLHLNTRNVDFTLDFTGKLEAPSMHFHAIDDLVSDWTVTLADTGLDTLTGGRIARIAKYLDQDTFMLTYGDGVGNIDLRGLLSHHVTNGELITTTGVHPPARFGRIEIENGKVSDFAEKPQAEDGYISGGFMVANRAFITHYLSESASCVLERDALPSAARDGVMGDYHHHGFWMPMDNHVEYNALNKLWASGEAPWKIW